MFVLTQQWRFGAVALCKKRVEIGRIWIGHIRGSVGRRMEVPLD